LKEKAQGSPEKRGVEDKIKPQSKSAQKYLESDVITVKDIAHEADMPPSVVRKKIRNSNLEKPGGRWEWPPNHPDLIKVKSLFGIAKLGAMDRKELKELCKEFGIKVYKKDTDEDLREKLRGEK